MASSAAAATATEPSAVQLLLRNIDSRTAVVRARREDTLDSVLGRLGEGVARRGELRVVYAGRELPRGATIGELGLPWDATLHVSSRLRSTPHADAWNLASEIVAAARLAATCGGGPGAAAAAASLEELVRNFLDLARASSQRGYRGDGLGPVADHMDILVRSGVPVVLVQLYFCHDEPRSDAAGCAIGCFLSPDPDPETGPSIVKAWTAPVLLELCASLSAGARTGDPLYTGLRGMLATVLSDPDWTTARWLDLPPQRVAEQVARLAGEMADAVIADIAGEYWNRRGAAASNLAEFKTFWSVLRGQVVELGADTPQGPWSAALTRKLESLLMSVEGCMACSEMYLNQPRPPSRKNSAPSIAELKLTASRHTVGAVLAELDAWSELETWPDLVHALRATLGANRGAVTMLMQSSGTELCRDMSWITRHRDLLTFEARSHLAMAMLPELVVGSAAPPPHEMLIDRSLLLSDSFGYIARATPQQLRGALVVAFKHEHATGPGVLREWFCLVCQALFNPRLVLFSACPQDRRRFFVNPTSTVDPLHQDYFDFAGRMIALALRHKIHVGVFFDRTFLLQLAGRSITLDDIADADPSLHASCKKMLEMDSSIVDSNILGLTFVREVEALGSRTVTELFPGGKDIGVTSENRCKYIDLLIRDRFVNCTSRQLGYFTTGFGRIFNEWKHCREFFKCLDVEDFDRMLGGSKDIIDVKEWRANTDYRGYKEKDRQIKWFWKAVESMTVEQQRRLLFFWTSVKYLPSDGFSGLGCRLFIFRASSSRDHLPTSQTCFFHLNLPAYSSSSMMQNRLLLIVQEHVSSGFGAS